MKKEMYKRLRDKFRDYEAEKSMMEWRIESLENSVSNENLKSSKLQAKLDSLVRGSVQVDRVNDYITLSIRIDRDTIRQARSKEACLNLAINQLVNDLRREI